MSVGSLAQIWSAPSFGSWVQTSSAAVLPALAVPGAAGIASQNSPDRIPASHLLWLGSWQQGSCSGASCLPWGHRCAGRRSHPEPWARKVPGRARGQGFGLELCRSPRGVIWNVLRVKFSSVCACRLTIHSTVIGFVKRRDRGLCSSGVLIVKIARMAKACC